MKTTYEFTIGQKVKMYDEDDKQTVYGRVVDKTRDSVFIQWEDLSEPAEHQRNEFPKISLSIL